jgi:leucyl-tRNA synthetase
VDCPRCGAAAERETDTFDTFMESSWYYARFACADNDSVMLDERAKKWTPVDHYVGGIEHAVLHLLYSRFYHKLLRDEGLVDSDEPFKRLLLLGMVLKDGRKMSKSAGNIVSPNELIDRHGADALRTFMMFAAPPDQTVEWSDSGVDGATRFLRRLWGQVQTHLAATPEVRPAPDPAALSDSGKALRRLAHETLAKADDDFGRRLAFNTVVSAVMSLSNELGRFEGDDDAAWALRQEVLSIAVQVLSPIAPHLCHRLWLDLGHPRSVVEGPWLTVDEAALARDEIDLVVQVNGKLRGKLTVPAQADQAAAEARAREEENVLRHLEGKTLRKVIYVPGKLLNFVVGG